MNDFEMFLVKYNILNKYPSGKDVLLRARSDKKFYKLCCDVGEIERKVSELEDANKIVSDAPKGFQTKFNAYKKSYKKFVDIIETSA